MTDREKIIKGLECCTTPGNCGTCPWYPSEDAEEGCIRTLMKAMLELLKAQEPVKPIERNGFYYCGACRYAFTIHKQKYCTKCGRAVKWE